MSFVDMSGNKMRHFENGLLHNKNGPAVVYNNGFKAWYINGELINAIDQDGFVLSLDFGFHFPDGIHYRKRGGLEMYTKNWVYNNDDGPAMIDHFTGTRVWFIDGKETKRETFTPDFKPDQIPDPVNEKIHSPDGTIEYYQRGILVSKHDQDGSVNFFDEHGTCIKKLHPKGHRYELDSDGYWNVTFAAKPSISFDVDGDTYMFTTTINNDVYTVQVTPESVVYRKNDKIHRDHDLPARKTKTSWEYYNNGKLIKQHTALDQPLSVAKTLVNRKVLESKIKHMPSVDQDFLDDIALEALTNKLEAIYVIQQFILVLNNKLSFDEWVKINPTLAYLDACCGKIIEFLATDSSESRLSKVLECFITSEAIWRKYANLNLITKPVFVQRLYNKALQNNFSNDFKAKLLTFQMR